MRLPGVLALGLLIAPCSALAGDNLFGSFDVSVGLGGAGPALFRDTADGVLEDTSVFEYGTRLGFRFGQADLDPHRFGLTVGYHALARSTSRKLGAVDPQLVYATGDSLEIQAGLGYRVALADAGFLAPDGANRYGGMLGSMELRKAFRPEDGEMPVGVTASVFAEGVLTLADPVYSTTFIGARIELAFFKTR